MVEHLTKEQIGDCKKLFDEMDLDRDGKLTFSELKAGCKTMNLGLSDDKIKEIITIPKGGRSISEQDCITFPEFLISMSQDNPDVESISNEIITAFKIFDHDGTGEISITELKHVLTNMGHKFTDEEVDEMFSAAGITADKTSIDYVKFVRSTIYK